MAVARLNRPPRRGLTLVELLMVITIMTILLAVAVPMVRPAFQDRNLREAARQVNVFLAGAQARAAELGRPVGVWIERIDDSELGSRHASRLYMAEVAPSFNGAALDSRATVTALGAGIGRLNLSGADDTILRTLVAPNEKFTVKFDHRGHDYQGLRQPAGPFEIQMPWGVPPGAADGGPGLPYAITRGPVRSSVAPLTLPGDSVIDLALSGVGTTGRELDSSVAAPWVATPVIILFAPSGRVDYVYVADRAFRPFASLHLLIGRKGKVVNPLAVDTANPVTTNLADPTSLWITISERTGAIVTSDNADTSQLAPAAPPPPYNPSVRLKAAREFARLGVQKGGR
jgi:prepilin-type N-terminal cleavage/methylation domain-containing protein